MGLFKSTKLFCNVAAHADSAANNMMASMRAEGYEVEGVKLPSGDWDISIKKGNMFAAILGMQTALKVLISPAAPHVYVKAGVGIFGQQAIPTLLTTCVWLPFAIPQIWGLIKQSKLDEQVMDKVHTEFSRLSASPVVVKIMD